MANDLILDSLLVAGFGIQHSALATISVKARVKRLWGIAPIEWRTVQSAANIVYVLIAAALWRSSDLIIWDTHGLLRLLLSLVVSASWLWYWQLHLFEYDVGLAFGSTSLVERLRDRSVPHLVPWKVGTRRWIRFPVHTAFFGMFLALPTMTADLLVLGLIANAYNVIGSVLYDKRLVQLSGEPYLEYVRVTGLIWPPVYRAPAGAAAIKMPVPQHWDRPARHLPGIALGLAGGAFYWLLLGRTSHRPMQMALVGLAGIILAIVGGLIIGAFDQRFISPAADDDQQQTDLSTTVAVMSALAVVTWIGMSVLLDGGAPGFAAFLPLWFIVQYLGHVVAYLATLLVRRRAADEALTAPKPATRPTTRTI